MSETEFRILDDNPYFMEKYPNGIPLVELIPFYEAVARNEPLKLEWVCPGRINPHAQTDVSESIPDTSKTVPVEPTDAKQSTAQLTEFDFDEPQPQPHLPLLSTIPAASVAHHTGLPIRRAVGVPRQPRVASMDKILSDFFKGRKESQSTSLIEQPTPTTTSQPPQPGPPTIIQADTNQMDTHMNQYSVNPESSIQQPDCLTEKVLTTALSQTTISPPTSPGLLGSGLCGADDGDTTTRAPLVEPTGMTPMAVDTGPVQNDSSPSHVSNNDVIHPTINSEKDGSSTNFEDACKDPLVVHSSYDFKNTDVSAIETSREHSAYSFTD